jgi:acetolactate synthase-1/2/3 large subunit
MKVADFVIKYLEDLGIKEVFLVYGSANGDLVDAFTRMKKIKYVSVMHEQAGGFMAEGYARVSRNFGVAIATSGPGGMNLITPAGNCYYDSIPCLFITGQISTQYLRPSDEVRQVGFQESDMVGMMKPVTKYSVMVTEPRYIKYELQKALHLMRDGRPGPVHLDLPLDVQKAEIGEYKLVPYHIPELHSEGPKEYIDKLYELASDLEHAKRPVLLIGGGFRKDSKPLLDLGRLLKIPLIPTWNALDVVTNDYEYYGGNVGTYGGKGRNFAIQNCDLLVAFGSRISGRITGGNPASFVRGAKKWTIDIDSNLTQPRLQQLPFDYYINNDAFSSASDLLSIFKSGGKLVVIPDYSEWWNKVKEWRDKYDPVKEEYYKKDYPINPYVFARLLSKILPSNSIIVTDCGGNVVVMNQAFEVKQGQRFFSNNGNSPMGFSFSGAIGAWFASDKKQPVICVIGDGGMNMNIQELQTIKTYGVNIKVFIMNNHIYGITKAFQETNFQGRAEACGPKGYNPPDFIKIAEAYGINSVRINSSKEMVSRIQLEVLEKPHTVICDIDCHEWHTYEPRVIGWNTPIEDMYPYLKREEFLSNMIIPPFEGYDYKNPKMPDIIQTNQEQP